MKKELIVYKNPKTPMAEMFRNIRTNLQFKDSKKEIRSIVVTSTMPEEGKSLVCANLAITYAQAGKRTVIVDADMRKGRMDTIFDVKSNPGFSDYLKSFSSLKNEKNINIENYIRPTEIENLWVIPSGRKPSNPAELLQNKETEKILENLLFEFDIVLFDGTPSLLVTDAVILSRIVDATIIVAAYNQTKTDDLKNIKKKIEGVGGNIAGVVFNKVPVKRKKYGYGYSYGYYY